MSKKVFLSVGRASTTEQEEFICSIEKYLQSQGLVPQTAGRSVNKNLQALKSVGEIMRECSGFIILAYERTLIGQGVHRRGADDAKDIINLKLTTVWNQIETSMAYTLALPILVIVEKGIKNEGLLEEKYDWVINWVDIQKSPFDSLQFIGIFNDWRASVEKYDSSQNKANTGDNALVDVSNITFGQIIKSLKPAQLWGILTAIVAALLGVATVAFKLGSMTK